WREFVAKAMESPEIEPQLYLERYPELERLPEDHDVNTIARNLVLNCGEFIRRDSKRAILEDNVITTTDAALTSDTGLNLQALAPFLSDQGLAPIPFGEIGLYGSAVRAQTP
ncbi:MAG TPA: hypothetical protein PK166_18675, partial [Candidatus Hydrogenedentes bacterium]|nr:hypothetical protein [Candidatus Hydrogenedentota bacterium]